MIDLCLTYNLELHVCACSVGGANNNKLSLVGMQLPEKYKENFDVSSEGPCDLISFVNIHKYCLHLSNLMKSYACMYTRVVTI
jgi:hypothetical protein